MCSQGAYSSERQAATILSVERRVGGMWVTLPDGINMDTYERIEQRIAALVEEKPPRLIIDLSGTKNMYSAGFGMIVRLKKLAESKGVGICLVNVNAQIVDALTAVGLNRVLPIYEEGATLDFS